MSTHIKFINDYNWMNNILNYASTNAFQKRNSTINTCEHNFIIEKTFSAACTSSHESFCFNLFEFLWAHISFRFSVCLMRTKSATLLQNQRSEHKHFFHLSFSVGSWTCSCSSRFSQRRKRLRTTLGRQVLCYNFFFALTKDFCECNSRW